ncbi:glycosyl hydrolase family 3 N terminal domain-containing protein [Thelonectria olida]|uniref:beta-glucosidase n=1 Tax=Thelonectria olida TaxID=1576542 RepID=A0A9P8VSB9_9HYPO|nr:glycosyl hydrolase family 3 N terminal domain-containing protein [Thelonectria olida]
MANETYLLDRLTVEEKRDDVFIPHIKMSDGPNGARGESYVSGITAACFPCSTCVGATFDVDRVHQLGEEIAKETMTKSANVILAPTMNIIRSPLGGRNYETYSEDPYVIGTLAAAFVNGCQSQGIAATPKHFVANDSEKRRTKMTSEVDEQTLREIYMLPFQLVFRDSDPCYNRVNGDYCAESHRLIEEILRKEWRFSGVVVSDWLGTYSTAKAVNSGLDLEMPGPTRWRGLKLLKEIENASVSIEAVDRSVERILALARKTGRFEDPEETPERSALDHDRMKFITNLAAEGAVLLKNDGGLLPLPPGVRVAVIGHHAANPAIGGGGSAKVLAPHIVSPLDALKKSGLECRHAPGVPVHATVPHFEAVAISAIDGAESGQGDQKALPILLQWFNGSIIGQNEVYQQRTAVAEYMIKEAWPEFLDRDYCTRMSFALSPSSSGDHIFSVITTGAARVFVNGKEVYYRAQEPVLQPESFYFYKAKIEHKFRLWMATDQTVKVEIHSWAADADVLARVAGTVFQGSSLRFMEYINIPKAIEDAAVVAAEADVAVVFVGNTNEIESEGYDRETMDLTEDQYSLVSAVAARNPKTVVVNFSGSPVTVAPFIDHIPVFLQAWFAGQECGNSVAKVLTGAINPCGKLPMSWPRKNEDNPAYKNFPCDDNDVLHYEEMLRVGYRFYDEQDTPNPQFHFGYGLSYTTFELFSLKMDSAEFGEPNDTKVILACEAGNTGSKAGKAVVQIYVSYNGASTGPHHPRPPKELKSFKKLHLEPGERRGVEFALDKYAFSFFDAQKGQWKLQGGTYTAHASFSSAEMPLSVELNVPTSHYWNAAGAGGWLISESRQTADDSRIVYATRPEMKRAVKELEAILGEDNVSIDDEILQAHGYSEWSSINVDRLPVAVVYPSSTEDVSKIAKVCHAYRVPMIPYSGGSSVEGHFSAPFGGISVDFYNMSQVLEFQKEDMNIRVQPSVSWMDLNEKIKESGLFFPIDPGPSAQIGGMVGTNCSGTNAVRYGTMRDWVVNLTVVLSDGTILKTRKRPRKSSAGYSLNALFVGSEGTLGFVTEVTLKLATIPEENGVAVIAFNTIKDAASMAVDVIHKGIPVGAVEILDEVQMNVINRVGATGRVWKEAPTLFFKFGGTKVGVVDSINQVRQIANKYSKLDFQFENDAEKQEQLWSARKEALWSMLSLRESGNEVWSTDVAVPLSRVAELIELSKKDLDGLGLFGSILGHVGDGNFHETILFDGNKERAAVEDAVHKMVHRALDMEGTCTGEHGIGLGKKEFLREELGEAPLQVMRSIKRSLDPHWLMNPGKIFDPEDK